MHILPAFPWLLPARRTVLSLQRRGAAGISHELHVEGASPRTGRGSAPQVVEFARDRVRAATLKAHRPLHVTCTAGTVWLTCERDPRDYVLEAGDRHLVQPRQSIVMLGMPRGAVVLSEA